MMKRSTAALLAAALVGSVSSAPALAGPDSTSIRPPPVGSAPLRASSAARADTSDVSARALLLDRNATIDGSRITGVVQNAMTSLEANQANGLAAGATINGSQVTGAVANAARSESSGSADHASQIWDARTNTWQWVNNVTVTRSDSTGTADRANQLYNNYNGNYDWASNLRVGVATNADRASSSGYSDSAGTAGTADRANQMYNNYTGGYDWASNLRVGNSDRAGSSGYSDSAGTANNSVTNVAVITCRQGGGEFSVVTGVRTSWANGHTTTSCPSGTFPE